MGATATATSSTSTLVAATSYYDLESGKLIEVKNSASNSYSNPIRIYANNTFTFHCKSGATKITKIEITANSNSYGTATKNGTWSASGTGTCSASASVSGSKVTVTVSGTATTVTVKPSEQIRWNSVTVTYEVAAPSYTVNWTINPAAGGSLSATSGTSTTVTPNSAYTYGSPAYTVTTGTASVSQSTNTFTATPSANCTIRINMVEKPKYTITYDAGSGSCATSSWTQTTAGQSTTLPTATTSCSGWTFAGWCTNAAGSSETNTTSPGDILTGSYTPTSNVTLHAVYTKTEGTPETWNLVSAANDVTAGTYVITWDNSYYLPSETAANSNPAVGSGITQSNSKLTNTVTSAMQWTFTGDNTHGFAISHVSGNNTYKLSASNTAQGISVTAGSTDRKWTASVDGTYGMLLHGDDGGSRYLAVYNNGSWRYYSTGNSYSGTLRLYKKTGGSTTYYMTSLVCCSPLAQIIGSFSFTNVSETAARANWSWDKETTGINKNILKVYDNSNDVLVKTIDNISASATSYDITGLTPCKTYYVKLTTVSNGGTYCEGVADQTGASKVTFTTNGWAVHYDGGDETEGPLLSNVTKITGATSACTNANYVATFEAAEGYKLPNAIIVYLAGGELTVDEDYTWAISNGVGTLTILTTSIEVNEEFDVRIIGECVTPSITVHPAGNTYPVGQGATALSVTASAAGATLGYQWQTSLDDENWIDILEANGGKAATYTPSTAAAGTTYYRVIVSNKATDCTTYKESNSAAIEVSSIPVCETPTFTAGGTYNAPQEITISCATEGATIYYTMGTNPADPTTSSTPYDPEHKPVVSASATIKAIAIKAEYTTSSVGSATYVLKCLAPTFTPAEGAVVNGQEIALSCTTAGASIYYSTDGNAPTIDAQHLYDADHKPAISAVTTIKAIAVKDNWTNSDLASAAYTVKYTVSLNIGGGNGLADATGWSNPSTGVYTQTQANTGASITLPDATLMDGLVAAGWSFAGWKTSAVSTETSEAQTFVNTTYTPTGDITLYAVYEKSGESDVEDEITLETTGVTGGSTTYTDWSNKTGTSGAVYAGQSAGGNNSIQIRAKNSNSGVISTTSGGKLKKVVIDWNSNATDDRFVTVSGNTSAYTSPTNLFNESTKGTDLGTIVVGTSTELDVTGNYTHVGIRANDAIYIDKITITWTAASKKYYSNPSSTVTLTYNGNGQTSEESTVPASSNHTIGDPVTVVAKPEGLVKTGYTFGGWNTKDDGTGTNYENGTDHQSFTINDNTTLYAKWTINTHKVSVSSVDHGTITATPAGASEIAEVGNNAAVAYGTVVTLVQANDTHFTFGCWTVTKDGDAETVVEVTNNAFTMPDYDVVISATFTQDAQRTVKFYSNGEQVGSDQEVYVGEAPSAPTAVYESCLEGSDHFYGWTTEEWTGAINATTLADKTVITGDIPAVVAGEGAVNYYAVWAKATATPTTSYAKITNGLADDNYVIAYDYNGGTQIVLENTKDAGTSDTQLEGTALSLSSNKYVDPAAAYIWALEKQSDNSYYIYNANTEKYLNATTTALTLSATPTKFDIAYDNTNSRWTIQLNGNSSYYLHGYVNGTAYDFRISESGSGAKYHIHLYKNEKENVYSEFRTNCCGLKPVTNLTASEVAATSVTLSWTAPSSTTGITKLQVVNADTEDVLKDHIAADATGAEVTGLVTCTTYNFKVVSVGSDCSSNSAVVSATPQEAAKTVTFKYNDGATEDLVETTTCEADYVSVPANPSRSGFRFMGWKNGDDAVTGATFTPTSSTTTINATWAQLYTVYYDFAGATTGVAPADATYIAGEKVTLTDVEPNKGFLAPFKAWEYSVDVTVTDGKFDMPESDVTITATYDEIVGQWIKVTDASTLAANDYVVIASEDFDYAMSTTQNTNNRGETAITKSGNTMSAPSDNVQVFVLESGTVDGSWAFKGLNGGNDVKDKYIYASGTSSNLLKSTGTKSASASWVLDVANGKATSQGDETRNIMSYNGSNNCFAAYGSVQGEIALYQFREGTFYAVNLPSPAPIGGTVSTNKSMAKAGETVTLTYAPSRGYTVNELTVTGASGSVEISPAVTAGVTEYTFTMPAEAVTVAASFTAVPPVDYTLVENAADLAVGMQFVLVAKNNSNYYANSVWDSDHMDVVGVPTPSEKNIAITTEEIEEITLEGESDSWKLMLGERQLFNKTWSIAISESEATISNSNEKIMFNYIENNSRFKNYTNNQTPVALYALPTGTTFNLVIKEGDNTDKKSIKIAEGYTYTYTLKAADAPTEKPADNYEFVNKWTDGTAIYAVGETVEVSAAKTLSPCWEVTLPAVEPGEAATINSNTLPASVTEIVVEDNMTFNVTSDKTYDNLIVEAGGHVSVAEDQTLTVNDFTIESAAGKSGQLIQGEDANVQVTGDIYMDVKFYSAATLDETSANQWYMISAPFAVNLNGGFLQTNGTPMVFGTEFDLFYYDGQKRANTGTTGWTRVQGQMPAGRACLIGFNEGQSTTIRLKAASNTISDPTSITLSSFAGDADNANWNGVANPRMRYTNVDQDVQVWNNEENNGSNQGRQYVVFSKNQYSFVVGTPFFVQATGTMSLAGDLHSEFRAPKRNENTNYEYCVRIAPVGVDGFADQMYVRASDEATNTYEQGHDMITWNGTSGKSALLWSENYGMRLAIEEAPLANNGATYVLGLYAPADGVYTISTPTEDEDATLYLTLNGRIIWNLSMAPYTAELQQGQNEGYGLKIVAAPKVTTDVENTEVSYQNSDVQKVIIDEHVYILRGGEMYDVTGKMVK